MTTVIPDELTELEQQLDDNIPCNIFMDPADLSAICGKPAHWRVRFTKCDCPPDQPSWDVYLLCDQHKGEMEIGIRFGMFPIPCNHCQKLCSPIPPITRI